MSNVPDHAPKIWHNASTLWLAFPSIPGQPAAVLAFSLTEGGLAKALKSIRSLPSVPDPRILGVTKTAGKMLKRTDPRVTRAKRPEEFSTELRATTRDILRRLRKSA